jgi:hypothetical protein
MWKSTDVVDALPAITCVAGTTCFRSKKAVELAAIDTLPSKSMLLIVIDAVTAAVVGLQITMLVTTAVLPDGVVYRVVLVVAAAVRASTLDVVAISYYIPFYDRRSAASS